MDRLSGVKTIGVLAMMSLSSLLPGCAEDTPSPQAAVGSAESDAGPPAWFEDRPPLPGCDLVVLDQGDQVPDAAAECLFADGDSGVELLVRRPTVEGDPIDTYYRRLPGVTGLDVMSDATQDRFGSGGWRWVTCPDASCLADLGDCTTRAVEPR